ncbi:MAG: ABC transporter permease [Erysipelothrix sp.]|nr:ABC transporter permease [Erysipelothrix sp.]
MNRLWRPIKEGFKGVFRHFGMSLSAISAVMVTLVILGVFLLFYENVNNITTRIEESVQIYVTIQRTAEDNVDSQVSQINSIDGVSQITFISKEDEIKNWIAELGPEYEPYQNDNNPLFDAYTVTIEEGSDIVAIANQINNYSWSREVSYGGADTVSMINLLDGTRYIGYVFVVALTLLAIFLISNSIKMSIHSRANEIGIMRIVGATNGFIRSPFIVEGLLIGLFGSIIPVLVVVFGYQRLYNLLGGRIIVEMFQMVEPQLVTLDIALIIVIIAMIVGIVGSFISVSRYLRWKR